MIATVLILANALLALIFAFSSPTFKAIVREMVLKERIISYNSISNAGRELISMVGPLVGFFLLNAIGSRGALLVNAITFLISALAECFLTKLDDNIGQNNKKERLVVSIENGLHYLWKEKSILFLLLLSALVNFFLAGYNLLLPYTDVLYEDIFKNFYSKAMVAEAIGAVLGSLVNSKLPVKITKKYITLILFLGMTGGSLILVPMVKYSKIMIIALLPIVLFGIFLTMFNINYMSFIQINVDEEYLGRVFSVIFTVAVLFMPFGSWFFALVNLAGSINGFRCVGLGIVVLSAIAAATTLMSKNMSKWR
ncbi:Major Facilitator Superfamily protein [Butyrivibrio hungatei DSM 14810]|uniref:Major Facilitator Superfamily protein n=1 Tax=Butyrivibrio hungatei DSM 14810 TaxID=1121132 RepID=A0A1M7SH46_9FIRM|nr:Major Facilitator Superfamily protein [Butyrivibrio hungatei DSM 14810]